MDLQPISFKKINSLKYQKKKWKMNSIEFLSHASKFKGNEDKIGI
jgi:hypothetical protein